ncbi:MAG: hypothetical protein LBJ86_07130 [Spirochaetaceae bacterium]|jgi:hypothetical protein|nr:hypothetical protein [Spirochaetaceae bacterium]
MKQTLKIIAAALLVPAAASCGKLDVVGSGSASSFEKVLELLPAAPDDGGWTITAPDGSRFFWSRDYSKSPRYDVMIEFDAAPFLAAGLDPVKLPENFTVDGARIRAGAKLGGEQLRYSGEITPLASYQQLVRLKRSSIGYHAALDHYGVNLGGGNLFEWAKDMTTNDKDIVFVLDPAPLVSAGANPAAIDGWLFTKVTVDDENGKPVQVDKVLKPFDLR